MNKLNNNLLSIVSIEEISYESLCMKSFIVNGIFGFHYFENSLFKIKYEKDDLISYIDRFDNLKEFILLLSKKFITKYNMVYEKFVLYITYKGKRYIRNSPLFNCYLIGEKEISLKSGFFIYDIKLKIKNTNDSKDIPLSLEIMNSKREILRIESNSVSFIVDILDLYMNLIFEDNLKKIGARL